MDNKLHVLQKQKKKPTKEQLNKQADYVIAIHPTSVEECQKRKLVASANLNHLGVDVREVSEQSVKGEIVNAVNRYSYLIYYTYKI